eukprot:m.363030 g.363030  ORF g.363030 m.363030 type:complete len:57 (+) comp16652_c3_seq5:911-1081(+)
MPSIRCGDSRLEISPRVQLPAHDSNTVTDQPTTGAIHGFPHSLVVEVDGSDVLQES